ncbi:MAG: type IV pilus biogenesis/stability protein PilW [Gammaproteobacteria bacterium]|nr:type IV pilus biogenesis/stability protein PilW [Pseudomonadales bacterium]MCP5346641.1 type IV pilus biogenesis/stability protein PilW [Pseudomonadales bacterium]
MNTPDSSIKGIRQAFPERVTGAALTLLLSLILNSCVTTTTGGFNPEVSEDEALQDYIRLAVAYYEANDMAGARRHIANAMEINDRSSEVYNILALVHQREGDLDLADEAFNRAIRLDRNNSRARNNYAAFLFGQQRYQDAYQQLELVSNDTTYEGRPIAFENLGRSALRMGNTDAAERAFERALQLNGNLYISALELAQIRFDKGAYQSARSLYNQYLTTKDFYNIPHTPRSLWIGIQIESHFQNQAAADTYARLLTALYQDSAEYQLYQTFVNGN